MTTRNSSAPAKCFESALEGEGVARQQQYVLCPSCGDPVVGPFPRPGEFIECTHCHDTFPCDPQAVETALVTYEEREKRWRVAPIRSEMDTQVARILDLCSQAVPSCIVHVMPVGPDSFRVPYRDFNALIATQLAWGLCAEDFDEPQLLKGSFYQSFPFQTEGIRFGSLLPSRIAEQER